MAEVIALLYQEICYRGVCYKSVPLCIHPYPVQPGISTCHIFPCTVDFIDLM